MLTEKQIKQMGKQNKKLLENRERYEEKKAKQQESKVYGQKPVKGRPNKEKEINVCNSSRS